jgi:glycosyltransferase involved in cell wall biosynthesis
MIADRVNKMRIGIDYTPALRQGGGIGRYTRNLVEALTALDGRNEYVLLAAGGRRRGRPTLTWPRNFRLRSIPLSDRWLNVIWQRLRLPLPVQLVTGRLDLYHSPDFVLPPVGGTPTVLTVHDLSFLRLPQFFVPAFRTYLETAVTRAVRRADHILADSESTRHDLGELLAVPAARVSVLYPGVEERFQPVRDPEVLARVRGRYRLPARFVLGVGTLQPRKNFEGLVEAFGRLLAAGHHLPELGLVIAGGEGWLGTDLLALAERLGVRERVILAGFVKDEDLPGLYSLADALAFPSWYEGFGLPVLEAMACGTPVVSADNSSLPEVVGDAGLLVDAGSPDELADALALLLLEEGRRSRLVEAGWRQARRFRWENAARQLLEVYHTTCRPVRGRED